MTKGKRLSALLIALSMILVLIPCASFAADGTGVILAASYPNAKSVVVDNSAKTITVTVAASASSKLEKNKLDFTFDTSVYNAFTKEYVGEEAPSVDKAGQLVVSYYKDGIQGGKTTYSVYVRKAASVDPDFSGFLTMSLVKGTSKTIDYDAIKKCYQQNDGKALEYVEFADITTKYRMHVGNTKFDDLSSGVTVSASNLKNVRIEPLAAGTSTLKVTAYQKGSSLPVGEMLINVNIMESMTLKDIAVTVDSTEVLTFSELDIPTVFWTENKSEMTKITFQLPSSSCGTLYESYNSLASRPGVAVSESKAYSVSELNNIVFVPAADFRGTDYVFYTATNGTVTDYGRIKLSVNTSVAEPIAYKMTDDEVLVLSASDIKAALKEATGVKTFDRINFTTLPDTTLGALYYDYQSASSMGTPVTTIGKEYYYLSGSEDLISDISFVPKKDGTATIKYVIYTDEKDRDGYTGTISISISKSDYEVKSVSYTTDYMTPVKLSGSDFNAVFKASVGDTLNYIQFEFPSKMSSKYGDFFFDYSEKNSSNTGVSESRKYFYKADPDIDDITFVPVKNYHGTFSVDYYAYDAHNEYYTGKINITVKAAGSNLKDVSYTMEKGQIYTMNVVDIYNAFLTQTGGIIDSIKLNVPDAKYGTLYYNYYSATKYDRVITRAQEFYRSSKTEDLMSGVCFVPAASFAGKLEIPFTAYSSDLDDEYSGKIVLQYRDIYTNKYTDVVQGSFCYDSVKWAVENGIATGVSETSFGAKNNCTRAACVYYLWKSLGSPEPTAKTNVFKDVKETDSYYKAVLWAVENGVAYGTSETAFSPNQTVTRGQAMTFMHRSLGKPTSAKNAKFTDVSATAYYADSVYWAVENKVTSGTTATTFSPNKTCNKAEIITFLYNYYGK